VNADIRILRGHPTTAELAALTAVILALAARDESALRAALHRPSAGWALRQGAHRTAGSWVCAPRPTWQPSD